MQDYSEDYEDKDYPNKNYGPNDLAELSVKDSAKYQRIIKSNLNDGETYEDFLSGTNEY